jgi:cytochrome c556
MKIKSALAVILTGGLLASCAPMSPYEKVNSPDLLKTAENAKTYTDHYALTKRFETLAEEMRTRAEVQRKLLEHYKEKSYLYGRQAQDQQSHTWALMHRYEQAAKTSLNKAALHKQIAAQLERDGYAAFEQQAVGGISNLNQKNNWNN